MDGQDVDEERVYRTVLVKSLPPSTSKQNLIIHFQSRKNGGGDIEEAKLLDHGSAIITFEEEKVAKSVQKKEQKFNGVLLTVEQYKVQPQKEMEVFSKVSAIVNPKKLGLTMQNIQSLKKEIADETKMVVTEQDEREMFFLTGTFQQLQKAHHLLENFLYHGERSYNGNDSSGKDVSVTKTIPVGMQNGKEPHMNGTEKLSSVKDETKSATKKGHVTVAATLKQSPKPSYQSRSSSKPEKEDSPSYSGLMPTEKEKTENHKEISSSKPSEKHSGTRGFPPSAQAQFQYSNPNKEEYGGKSTENELPPGGKAEGENKYSSTLQQDGNINKKEMKFEISSKVWYVFVKIYEKELKTVMTDLSVHIEPDDNQSVAIIKPAGECREKNLEIASEKLKKLYEEGKSKMKSVRFALADPENREHDGMLRKTVFQVKKDFPVFLERAEDRQSWEIFGEISHVEKGMKLLEETVKLKRKEHLEDNKAMWEEAASEEDSDDGDYGEEDGDNWKYEKLEHQLGKVKVSVYRGDITEEHCDVIVNAANEKLEHGSGVAFAIVSKGGRSIQDECRRIVNTKGELKVGDVAVSPSGNLKCKMVIHAVGPVWKKHAGEEAKKLLKRACKESLMQAEKYGFESVAFPAVSSGIFGMPKHICSQVMLDVAEEYSKSVTSLRYIRLVNNDAKTVRAFRREFKTRYGSSVISETKETRSGEHAAKSNPVENPSMHREKKSFPTWDKGKLGPSATTNGNKAESTSYPKRTYSGESHTSRLCAVVAYLPGKAPSKSSHETQNRRHQNQPRVTHVETKDTESTAHTAHPSKHGIVKSYSFSGGAKPKESQSHFPKDECPICKQKMKRPKTLLKCKHTFCKACLEKALQHSPNCPYCREPVEENRHSPTLDSYHGANDYREDDVPYGSGSYDDINKLCLFCAKPARKARTLPCRHTFCRSCFDVALKKYPACPCCSELERHQDPYGQNMDFPQGFPPDFSRDPPSRSNRAHRPTHAHDFNAYEDQVGLRGNGKRRGQPGRGTQPDGTMMVRKEPFSLPGYDGYGTIVIQYLFKSGLQGPDHPNPGFRYDGTSRAAYLPDCPEGRQVLKMLKQAFDAGLVFRIGRSQTSKLDNQIIWADIPHKSSTSGGPTNYGYPDPTYLSDVKQQLQAALNGR